MREYLYLCHCEFRLEYLIFSYGSAGFLYHTVSPNSTKSKNKPSMQVNWTLEQGWKTCPFEQKQNSTEEENLTNEKGKVIKIL